jgi:hypothetical protein
MLDRRQQSLITQKSLFFNLFHPLLLFLLVQCHYLSPTVRAEANVTVDDGDSRITYSPSSAWRKSEQTQLNYGGSHMLTQNPNATAVFNFTGESREDCLHSVLSLSLFEFSIALTLLHTRNCDLFLFSALAI